MKIADHIAGSPEPVFSFEFFPPKTEEGDVQLRRALADLAPLEPSFVSVTYGALGTTRDRTLEITKWIKHELGIEAMHHLTCVGATREEIEGVVAELEGAGIENVLALRGDPPRGETEWRPTPGGLMYSTELIRLLVDRDGLSVGAACFPEVHPQAPDLETDLRFLREKVESGARFLITQLFFDNEMYFDFVAQAREAGIDVPIIPGIIPIANIAQVQRIAGLCGASIPQGLEEQLVLRVDDPDAALAFGIAYATAQCADLLARGAPGIHFYTLNRSPATRAILSALKLLRPWNRPA